MIEVTDGDIAEALKGRGSLCTTDEDVQSIKRRFILGGRDWFANDTKILAQTLAKLRVAVKALDLIGHGSSQEAASFAREILNQIRSE